MSSSTLDAISSAKKRKQRAAVPPPHDTPRQKDKDDNNASASAAAATTTALPLAPITTDGDRPQKRFYRQRAHCNPLAHNDSYDYPVRPERMVWHTEALYPSSITSLAATTTTTNNASCCPTVLDIGCGFGGLTLALASLLPRDVILGMEIRAKVTEYVRLRIVAARKEGFDSKLPTTTTTVVSTIAAPTADAAAATAVSQQAKEKSSMTVAVPPKHHDYNNCAVMRTNSMKFLPHYFERNSIRKVFFCFPDPHFKRKNHARRIVATRLLDEYAYILQYHTGRLYCITDVRELHDWHVATCDAHPSFRRLCVSTDDEPSTMATTSNGGATHNHETTDDPCVAAMLYCTEEGQKVDRNAGSKYYAVYQRVDAKDEVDMDAHNFFAN
jgi:tRNA (guanine-N7-)-methyltransferase